MIPAPGLVERAGVQAITEAQTASVDFWSSMASRSGHKSRMVK